MAARKSGFYHAVFAKPQALVVLKENKDGTVDIGTEDGVLVVGKCPVTTDPKPGHFTVGSLPEEKQVEEKEQKV